MSPIRPENLHRYPVEWPAIRAAIRERAADRCECYGECGRGTHGARCPNRHGEPAYGTGSRVVLTIAHLDHTPEHNHPDNLRAMCQGCHLHYDRDHHAQTRAHTRRRELETAGQLTIDASSDVQSLHAMKHPRDAATPPHKAVPFSEAPTPAPVAPASGGGDP